MDQNQFNELQQALLTHKRTRSNLLLVVVFSVVNIILLLCKSNLYFLFTAELPYILVTFGLVFTGRLSDGEVLAEAFFTDTVLYVFLIIAALIVIFYFCCWIFSKDRRKIWFILALIGFIIDTVICLYLLISNFDFSSVINIAFHIWVIVSLVSGIKACKQLEKYGDINELFLKLQSSSAAPNSFPAYNNPNEYTGPSENPYESAPLTDTQENYRRVMAEYEAQKAAEAGQNNESVQINSDYNNPNV